MLPTLAISLLFFTTLYTKVSSQSTWNCPMIFSYLPDKPKTQNATYRYNAKARNSCYVCWNDGCYYFFLDNWTKCSILSISRQWSPVNYYSGTLSALFEGTIRSLFLES